MTAEKKLIGRMGLPVQFQTFEEGGLRVNCAVAGTGSPVLLIHGLNIGWGEWYGVMPELAKNHTVYAIDMPGAGRSTRFDFRSRHLPDIMIKAVELSLQNIGSNDLTIVGHSLGAWAGFKVLAQSNLTTQGIVAINPLGFTSYLPPKFRGPSILPVAQLLARTFLYPNRKNLDGFLVDVIERRDDIWPEYLAYVHEHVTRAPVQHPIMLINRMAQPFRVRAEFDLSEVDLRAVRKTRTMFIHGAQDPLIPLQSVLTKYEAWTGANLAVLQGTGHVPPIETPADVVRLVEDFISSSPK